MNPYDCRMRRAAVALAALVLAPAAAAWTPLATGVGVTVIPSVLVTQAGTVLASYDVPAAGTIGVVRSGVVKTLVTGDAAANRTQLVQQPNGALQLYFPNGQGVGRMTSTDDGQTWTGPIQTQSHTLGPVNGAGVATDGTVYFAQDGTGFVDVFRGLNGEQSRNVYTRCCGYHESLAVDAAGLAQIAFYSNADTDGATVYQPLAADLAPGTATTLKPVAEHEAPLVADRSGTTFLAWAAGYPTAVSLSVVPFRGGAPSGDGVTFRGTFSGPEPHMALAVDPNDRLWLVWTQGGKLHAARSRSHGVHFGATVTTALPGTVYQLTAVGSGGALGHAQVVANTGSSLVTQDVQPGLSVRVFKTKKKKLVTWWAQALDDGFGVPHASFRVGGRTFPAGATGKAKVPHGRGTAIAQGYASASFRVP
jgi:hypothetical protein